ncbi:MAG: hypothetical protein IJ217_02350 [Clostridia bacterium]|nr:hypothetical protein [Clostridia bacterium]
MGQARGKKKNNEVTKLLVWLLIGIVVIVGAVVLATQLGKIDKSQYTEIKFTDMYETERTVKDVSQKLKLLNGQKVLLTGYMAEQSPVDESFIYLVNQPYVVCPFCTVGDTTKLEVMTVLMANGTGISFRTNAVNVYGTLEVEPKVDSFGYTTQFRILADRIENLEETEGDAEVNAYYLSLNEAGMILDIQQLQMNIDSLTNPETLLFYYDTENPVEIIDQLKADSSLDFAGYLEGMGMAGTDQTGQDAYVKYIKECPEIVASLEPENEKLAALNNELIEIYNEEIPILEKVMAIVKDIKGNDMTEEQKFAAYNELVSYREANLALFDQFNQWNNKLRE